MNSILSKDMLIMSSLVMFNRIVVKTIDFLPNIALMNSQTASFPSFKKGHNIVHGYLTPGLCQVNQIVHLTTIFNYSKVYLFIELSGHGENMLQDEILIFKYNIIFALPYLSLLP